MSDPQTTFICSMPTAASSPPSPITVRPSSTFCYALSALLHLEGGKLLSAGEIAQRAGMPCRYLMRILVHLTKAGVVEGARGCMGGYRLAKSLSKISVLEVLQAVDGPVGLDESELPIGLSVGSSRTLRVVLDEVAGDVAARLGKLTLAQLIGS
jgi:Rrf2 family protein